MRCGSHKRRSVVSLWTLHRYCWAKCTVSYTGFNMSDETPSRVNNNLCSPFRSMWGKVNSIASKKEYYHTRLNEKASRVQKQTPCIISNQAVSCAQSRSSLMRPNSHYHLLLNTTTSCPAANLLRLLLLLWALLKMNFLKWSLACTLLFGSLLVKVRFYLIFCQTLHHFPFSQFCSVCLTDWEVLIEIH